MDDLEQILVEHQYFNLIQREKSNPTYLTLIGLGEEGIFARAISIQ